MKVLEKIFGNPEKIYLEKLLERVKKINAQEKELEKFSDEDLKNQTLQLKEKLKQGASLDDILERAFALVREASKRTLGQRHFDVQLLGGMVLHQGKIAEMLTGEGKTLTATLPLYLNALEGKGCHLVTVNDYLARRDTVWMGQIYYALGLSVGCITNEQAYIYDPYYKVEKIQTSNSKIDHQDKARDILGSFKVFQDYLRPVSRKEAYLADITYGTNNEFGFDYLRDNMVYDLSLQVQRGHNFAIIDEIDSILIDEARTPLIISQPDFEAPKLYQQFASIVKTLKENKDYTVDEKLKVVTLTEQGISKVEQILGLENIYDQKSISYLHYLEQCLKAQVLFKKDRDYVVKENQVIIVDEFTGRLMPGRRYSEGLHQAIEAKEGLKVKPESKTLATITFQNYFRLYKKLAGMTGTAKTSAEEFFKVYNLEVVSIPPNKPLIRKVHPDKVFKTREAKLKAIIADVKARYQKGQPVLIGTTSIERNEELSRLLKKEGIPHQILNAKNHEKEGEIIAQAGRLGQVTCATNMAGRGVDIILGGNPPDPKEAQKVKELGGLYVIGTERHEARRIDNQLRGRCARQGDPGESQFYVSLEDDLMRIFGGDKIKSLLERFNFPEDEPISMPLVSRAIEEAQSKVEGFYFDMRKHLLEYDEVLNKHRSYIYKKRREFLEKNSLKEEIESYFIKEIEQLLEAYLPEDNFKNWDFKELKNAIKNFLPLESEDFKEMDELSKKSILSEEFRKSIFELLKNWWQKYYTKKEEELGPENMRKLERILVLKTLDDLWSQHLTLMEHLRDAVKLRVYGQRDPLVEYKSEGNLMMRKLLLSFESRVVRHILHITMISDQISRMPAKAILPITRSKLGRNEPCPCGSGKKYKKCHGVQ